MAAAKFSLKAQGLITSVYGALISAWEREISEQGSKKKKKGKKTSSVSEEEVLKATRLVPPRQQARVPHWQRNAQPSGGGRASQGEHTKPCPGHMLSLAGKSRANAPGRGAQVRVGYCLPAWGS